jgi:hypothetical protein
LWVMNVNVTPCSFAAPEAASFPLSADPCANKKPDAMNFLGASPEVSPQRHQVIRFQD